MTGVTTGSSDTLTVDNYSTSQDQVLVNSNTIESNFAGLKRSIMDFEGMPKVVFTSNTIQYNENYLPNAFILECSIYDQQTDTSSPT